MYVEGSNYLQTSDPFKRIEHIPFHQPPAITVSAPADLQTAVNAPFSYQVVGHSPLDTSSPLQYSLGETNPFRLGADVEVDSDTGLVRGVITTESLANILKLNVVPSISVEIRNQFGSIAVHTTTINFVDSAPIFSQAQYTFSAPEAQENSVFILGQISLIDPNDNTNVLSPTMDNSSFSSRFRFLPPFSQPEGPYHVYDVYSLQDLDYEERSEYVLEAVVTDAANSMLQSTATITVTVEPVNEFDPAIGTTRCVCEREIQYSVVILASYIGVNSDRANNL